MKQIRVSIVKKLCKDNMESVYLDYYPPIVNPDTQKLQRRESLNIKLYGVERTDQVHYVDSKGRNQSKIVRIYQKSKFDIHGKPIPRRVVLTQLQKNHNLAQMNMTEKIRLGRQMTVNKGDFSFLSKLPL
jgi:hypothetical protein